MSILSKKSKKWTQADTIVTFHTPPPLIFLSHSVDSKIYSGPVILEKYDNILARSFDESGRGGLTIKIKQNGNN